ncbi:hypothetical protein ACMG5I_03655 [Escherichia coli]|uniref:hypothetical protein n=1 Tax=Escherichia coli TaxID=562 RepID=UPI0039BFEF9B
MTKAELVALLESYPDDACIEVVHTARHFDIEDVVRYNDKGVLIMELCIGEVKTVPESEKRKKINQE